MVWRRHRSLLRSLAYDPPLFERSVQLLARAATQSTDEREAKEASDTFVSLFTIYLSGTHATIEQRLGVIERLLRSGEVKARALGLAALRRGAGGNALQLGLSVRVRGSVAGLRLPAPDQRRRNPMVRRRLLVDRALGPD